MLARGDMSEGHARAVLSVPDDEARRRLARRIVKEGLTVRAAERAAREGGARRRPRRLTAADPALVDRARAAAELVTGMPARVSAGTLQIRFDDEKGLEELVEALESASAMLVEAHAA
jgi:ParB family chromosome partitioning protein